MKRTVIRDLALPAFACDAASLHTLLVALKAHFATGQPRLSIDVRLENEELSFGSIDEMTGQQSHLPPTVQDIWISINDWSSDSRRSVTLSSRYGDRASVRAESDNTGWCAGATEIAKDFAMRHTRWYAPLRRWMVWLVVTVLGILPAVLSSLGSRYAIRSVTTTIAWVACVVFGFLVTARFRSIFPAFALRLRSEQRWFQRYAPEVTLLAAVISAVAAVVAAVQSDR